MMESPIFKPHIAQSKQYVGGSTRDELSFAGKGKMYKLSSNENLLGPSPKAMEALRSNLHSVHEYSYQHDAKFRWALSDFFNHELLPGQFITANSGLELIELIVRGFLDPGLECIVSGPTFGAYRTISAIQGATVIDVPLNSEDFSLNIKGILEAINDNTRLLFISNPNNPTGSFVGKKVMDYLMENIPGHVIVVYDEVYYQYVGRVDYVVAADYIKEGRNVIGLHSFSKAYGLAALRIGYAFSTPEIAVYLNKIRLPFLINALSMSAAIAALGDKEHIKATKNHIAAEKNWLYEQFNDLAVPYFESQANFILFRPLIAGDLFVEVMLENGIMVRSTDVFGLKGWIRVTIGTREANVAFIAAYKNIINKVHF